MYASGLNCLQVKYSFLYLLSTSLIPELRSDISAGAACNVHLILIPVMTLRALPDKLAVIRYYLYFSVIAAYLTIVTLCVELCVHDVVVDKFHYLNHCVKVVLHVRNLNI